MATRKEIKENAKNQLDNNIFSSKWLMLTLVLLVYEIVIGAVGGVSTRYNGAGDMSAGALAIFAFIELVLFVAAIIITGPLAYGICRILTGCARDKKQADFVDLGVGFKECMSDAILLSVVSKILIVLWTLLFIIPGIIKSYAYSMAFYIQQDQKNKDWRFCIDKSQEMMKGHKWDLFVLDLSFIGWYIVGLLCLGIGTLFVTPYHQMARANFYLELKKTFAEEDLDEVTEDEAEDEVDDVFEGDVIEGEVEDK